MRGRGKEAVQETKFWNYKDNNQKARVNHHAKDKNKNKNNHRIKT